MLVTSKSVAATGFRPDPPQYLSWFDVAGDGRYTYRQQYNEFRIDPSSTDDICREITHMMQVQQEFSRIH